MGHAIDPRSRSGDAAPAALDGISILAVRKDTTGALDPNGDVTPIQVDSDGALKVTGGGGGFQYTVDTPSTGIESGTVILAVRNDAGGSLVSANNDLSSMQVDANGALRVLPATHAVTQSGTWNVGSVTTLPALPTGTNAIGSVGVTSLPALPAGTNAIGTVGITGGTVTATIGTALPTGSNVIGGVTQSGTWNVGSITTLPSLPTGTNAIGSVGVTSLPALPTGSNAIGSVGVTGTVTVSLGAALPTGSNVIGGVTQSGTWNVGSITTLPALPTGSNVIGAVTQSGTWNVGSITTLPALPTGSNVIGAVTQSAGPWTTVERGTVIAHGSASVTTTAAQVLALAATRRSATIQNLGTDYIYIGATGISANNGLRLAAGQTVVIDKSPTAAIFAIAASGTQAVSYFTESD